MLKNLVTVFCLLGSGVLGYHAWRHFAPDDKKVAWVLQDTFEGFNEADLPMVMAGLHGKWRADLEVGEDEEADESAAMTRERLSVALRWMFAERRDDEKHFLYQLTLPPESLAVTVVDPESATASFRLEFRVWEGFKFRRQAVWVAQVKARLIKTGETWSILDCTYKDLLGKRPWHSDE